MLNNMHIWDILRLFTPIFQYMPTVSIENIKLLLFNDMLKHAIMRLFLVNRLEGLFTPYQNYLAIIHMNSYVLKILGTNEV